VGHARVELERAHVAAVLLQVGEQRLATCLTHHCGRVEDLDSAVNHASREHAVGQAAAVNATCAPCQAVEAFAGLRGADRRHLTAARPHIQRKDFESC
jgi:hypothetical protein